MKLKKCECCGEAMIAHYCNIDGEMYAIICADCFKSTQKYNELEEAVKEWNNDE